MAGSILTLISQRKTTEKCICFLPPIPFRVDRRRGRRQFRTNWPVAGVPEGRVVGQLPWTDRGRALDAVTAIPGEFAGNSWRENGSIDCKTGFLSYDYFYMERTGNKKQLAMATWKGDKTGILCISLIRGEAVNN